MERKQKLPLLMLNLVFGRIVWILKIPPKIKLFIWKVMNNFLPVKSNLFEKKIVADKVSSICIMHDDTLEHMLLQCLLCHTLLILGVGSKKELRNSAHPDGGEDVLAYLFTLVWSIWLGRNQCLFSLKVPDSFGIVQASRILATEYYDELCRVHFVQKSHVPVNVAEVAWLSPCYELNCAAACDKGES